MMDSEERTGPVDPRIVKSWRHPKGGAVAYVVESPKGLFKFIEEREEYQPPFDGLEGYAYVVPEQSGLYATCADAERAARLTIPWLRDEALADDGSTG